MHDGQIMFGFLVGWIIGLVIADWLDSREMKKLEKELGI